MPDNAATEKEKHMKQLKRRLECWREVVLPINSILLWEKSWYPGLILGLTTSIYLIIWILDPSLLTTIAFCMLTAALLDCLVPIVVSTFVSASAWNGQKEKKLEEICESLSATILQLQNAFKFLWNARNNRSNIYFGSITLCLLLLAWIGNTIDNLLLIYLLVNTILLTPGFWHKGRAQAAMKYAYNYVMQRKSS